MNLFKIFSAQPTIPPTLPRTVATWTVNKTGAPVPLTQVFRAPPQKPPGLYQVVGHVQRLLSGSGRAILSAVWRTGAGDNVVQQLVSLDLSGGAPSELALAVYTTLRPDTNVEFFVQFIGVGGAYRVRAAVIHVATFSEQPPVINL